MTCQSFRTFMCPSPFITPKMTKYEFKRIAMPHLRVFDGISLTSGNGFQSPMSKDFEKLNINGKHK